MVPETPPNPLSTSVLADAWKRASGDWPAIGDREDDFLARMLKPLEAASADEASALHLGDLYVATLAADGDAAAARWIVDALAADVRTAAARATDADVAQAACDTLWEKLLVGAPDRSPRIGSYTGRGPLRNWVLVVLARNVIDLRRRAPSLEVPLADRLPTQTSDPEIEFLKEHYAGAFRDALAEAVKGLTDRDRAVLGQAVVEGLDTAQIGAVYGVHRTTAGRWLTEARGRLLKATRRLLMQGLSVEVAEVDSILRLISSRMHVTFAPLLRNASG